MREMGIPAAGDVLRAAVLHVMRMMVMVKMKMMLLHTCPAVAVHPLLEMHRRWWQHFTFFIFFFISSK